MYELKIITRHLNELRVGATEETRENIEYWRRIFMSGYNVESTGRVAIFQDGQLMPDTIRTLPGFYSAPGDPF